MASDVTEPAARPEFVRDGGFTPEALAQPATPALAALAREQIREIRAARLRMDDPADPEGLHDFRVGLRRLRSLLRAYASVMQPALNKKLARRLRDLASSTNASRDLEVQIAWLEGQRKALQPEDVAGLEWLQGRLQKSKEDADANAHIVIADQMEPVLATLETRLEPLGAPVSSGGQTLAALASERLAAELEALDRAIGAVRTREDQAEAHEARIGGKRMRYLLEPLAGARDEAAELVKRCKGFQDVLGEMHDATVLTETIAKEIETASKKRGARVAELVRAKGAVNRDALQIALGDDPLPGLATLGTLAREAFGRHWRAAKRKHLGAQKSALLDPARRLAAELAGPPANCLEIEHKYLLTGLPGRARRAPVLEIEQGYLVREGILERLRRTRNGESVAWHRTTKRGQGLVREEIELDLTEAEFEAEWASTQGRRVVKRRYRVKQGRHVWEIDAFVDRELVLAEIELSDAKEEVVFPKWLAAHVEREVTDDPTYSNSALAR